MIYKVPSLCPLKFHSTSGSFEYDRIPSMEQKRGYVQTYLIGDRPYLQLHAPNAYTTIHVQLIDSDETIYQSWVMPIMPGAPKYGDNYVYHWYGTIPTVDEGVYFIRLKIFDQTGIIYLVSEPIMVESSISDFVKIEYTNDLNEFDIICAGQSWTVFPFLLRIEGGVKSDGLQPGGKYTMFQDLDYQPVMLQSQPYNVYRFTFGPGAGIPGWLADRINRIFSLSSVQIDGVSYMRNEGAKIERVGEDGYPLAGWTLDLLKVENDYSEEFDTEEITQPFTADTTIYKADSTLQTADMTEI